ncbi:MAG TPA: M14 family zinc carboxypeptidase, partial [Candidatus Thermoplasmatota archaeon]|nr:M14 family zinc carboxypeptidase [Candidatus Thermoplasmatota archaeon]
MRPALAGLLASVLLLAPAATAEFGPVGEDGWPLAVDGTSTNPFPGVTADGFSAAMADGDPLNRVGGTTVYPYWPLLTAEVQRLAEDHPERVRLQSIGKSTLGLDLWMLEIANFHAEGQPGFVPLEQREVVWVDGGTHSNEYSGVYFTLAWAQYLVEEYETDPLAAWIVDHRHTWILPMVNPDGSNVMGRLNANLVNINRNYPVVWDGEGHDELLNNRGPAPASEVETRLNIEWYNLTQPDYMASVHCCGNLWLYPYGEEGVDPVDQAMLQRVCDEAFPGVREDCGPIWSTIYPASGSSVDTAYEYTGAVAFGYEMSGRGAVAIWGQPLTPESVRTQETESWTGLLHAFLNVHLYGAYPAVQEVAADADGLLVTVRNEGYGNLSTGSLRLDMPSGDSAEVALPAIAAGGSAVVRVPCEEDGTHQLTVAYVKRLEDSTPPA